MVITDEIQGEKTGNFLNELNRKKEKSEEKKE